MPRKLLKSELFGIVFTVSVSVFLQNLYVISDKTLVGVIFGSANGSIWESLKTVALPFLMWGAVELMCLHPKMHRLAVVRVITLWVVVGLYLLLSALLTLVLPDSVGLIRTVCAVVAACVGAVLSDALYLSFPSFEKLFVPAMFTLLLFFALFFSFTPFPPHNFLFLDRATGLYGIVPKYQDLGAIALDSIYFL